MNLTKIVLAVVILLTIVLLISTNCKTKENEHWTQPIYEWVKRGNQKKFHQVVICQGLAGKNNCEKNHKGWCNYNARTPVGSPEEGNDFGPYNAPTCYTKQSNQHNCSSHVECKSGCCSSDSGHCQKHGKKEKDERCGDDCECNSKSCTGLFKKTCN